MDFNSLFSNSIENHKSVDKVLENHFENIDKGVFDSTNFCNDLQTVPPESVDYKKCVQAMMKLTKEKVTGTANYKFVHNLEKMMEIFLENFTEKKAGACEVLFFPSKESEERIIEHLRSAKKSIHLCMFAITNEHLCTALLEAHLRGVSVRIITDDEELRLLGTNVRDLAEEGIPIRTDGNKWALMHNKFVIIDQRIVMTGSYNWTARATKANQENVVVIENSYLTTTFITEFNKLWKQYIPDSLKIGNKHKKTNLYHKYEEALVKREQLKKVVVTKNANNDVDDLIDAGVNKKSKKISKFQKAKDLLKPKSQKKQKDGISDDSESSESSELSKSFLKILMTLFYLFSLIVFSRQSTVMDLEI